MVNKLSERWVKSIISMGKFQIWTSRYISSDVLIVFLIDHPNNRCPNRVISSQQGNISKTCFLLEWWTLQTIQRSFELFETHNKSWVWVEGTCGCRFVCLCKVERKEQRRTWKILYIRLLFTGNDRNFSHSRVFFSKERTTHNENRFRSSVVWSLSLKNTGIILNPPISEPKLMPSSSVVWF